ANDFPALSHNPPIPDVQGNDIYKVEESYGVCEVILYSPDHHTTLPELSEQHIEKLINLWKERFVKYAKDERIKYIFEFENRGAEVGVTMPHPHGQLYGYPYVPLKLRVELDNCKEHYLRHGSDLLGDM